METSATQHVLPRPYSPWSARTALAALVATAAFWVAITCSPLRSGFADRPSRGAGDVALYLAEIARIQSGESYYTAAGHELRARGYPTRSVFNWRTPMPIWFLGKLPNVRLGQALLAACGLALLLASFEVMAREGNFRQGVVAALLLSGALLPLLLGDLFVMTELWSGTMLALSAVLYGLGKRGWALTSGLAALFLRELAAPYCVICLILAAQEKRWRECFAWGVGFVGYAWFYAVHLTHVLPLIRPDDLAHAESWWAFGGAGFVISAVQMNAYLLLLPQWVTALFLTAAIAGCFGWNSAAGQRIALTLAAYLALFSMVGQPINQYWGSMIAPLLCLPAARFAQVVGRLFAAAWPINAVQVCHAKSQ